MEQIIITKKDGSEVPIQSRKTTTNITNAKQSIDLLSKDVVNITVESPFKQNYDIGDSITVFGRAYKLNRLPIAKKNGANSFVYELEFEGVQYDLLRATYDLTIETTNNQLQDFQANSLTGSLSIFATVWLANANRVFPGEWALGSIPETDEDRTLTFSEEANCLSVLSDFCKEFDTEYKIEQTNGVNTLHFGKVGSTHTNTFEYGKGKGIYQLTRQNVSSSNLVTRLKVFGSSRNITSKYRAHRLCMPGKTRSQSYIEDATLLDKYGIFEATKNFDDIYPTRTGKVTALGGDVLTFTDSTMFDLNEKEADRKTTKYLLPGVAAKIHFNSGNLAGYQFDVSEYDHETKTFIINKQTDDRGLEFPNETSQAFQFAVGDDYKLLDIALPQSYVDEAEAKLEAKGLEYYEQNSQPKVQYSLSIDPVVLEKQAGAGTIANIFMVGDYIKVKDNDIGVDKSIRVIGFVRNVLKPYEYALTISDSITESIINRVISESNEVDKIITQNNLRDPARARQNWRSAQEVLNMVFDPEGDYFTDKIKPESIETIALSVGAKSMQFGLTNTVFQPNYNGNKNLINVQGGVLSHYTINENAVRMWNLSSGETNFLTEDSYYIYARCERIGSAGSIIFSPEQIKTESDANYYHFLIGVVNSVDPQLDVRSIALSYGFSMVNGRFIRTGRISSQDGLTYFDLDNNEIKGKITFLSSTGDSVEMGDYAESIQTDITNAKTEAAEAAQTIAEAEAALAEANAIANAGDLVTAEQERAIADAEAKLQEAIDHANGIGTALQDAIDSVNAKANESKAITDAFGTSIDGGLVTAVMMYLREANTQIVTAGFSGIQGSNKDMPSFWSGGTYDEAFALINFLKKVAQGQAPASNEYYGLAPITFLHDGSAKIGVFLVERSGRIILVDPSTGKPRLVFNVTDLADINDLVNSAIDGGNINIGSGSTLSNTVLTGSTIVRDNSSATFGGTGLAFSASGTQQSSGLASFAMIKYVMYRNGSKYLELGSDILYFTSLDNRLLDTTRHINPTVFPSLPGGTYTFGLEIEKEGNISSASGNCTPSTFIWEWKQSGVRYFQFGKNGMGAFFSANHWWFTEEDGLSIRGKTDIPGLLASGSVSSSGSQNEDRLWGKKAVLSNATKTSTGVYSIPHSVGHSDYTVFANAHTEGCQVSISSSRPTNSVTITITKNGSRIDSGFDYEINGRNF